MSFDFWRRRDKELDEELQAHLQMAAQDRIDRGQAPEEALGAARREMGNSGIIQEVTRGVWGWTWLERMLQDLRFAARTLRKDAGFATVAVLTIALGVGANTAIFSLMHQMILQSLPVQHPEQLVMVNAPAMEGRPKLE